MKNNKVRFITYTAVFLALLIVFQYASKFMGQFVTGSLVNLVLIAATLISGIYSGVIIAVVSPFLAFSLGIGPKFIQIIPLIAIGNIVLVLIYGFFFKKQVGETSVQNIKAWIYAVIFAAVLKFAVLYFGIVKMVLPTIIGLPPKQAAIIATSFGFPQIITALIGGIIAFLILPMLQRAISSK